MTTKINFTTKIATSYDGLTQKFESEIVEDICALPANTQPPFYKVTLKLGKGFEMIFPMCVKDGDNYEAMTPPGWYEDWVLIVPYTSAKI
jgi:hypothetical protein